MKTALIIGGTGLTGKQLTHMLLGDKRYSRVVLLVRQPMNLIHKKLEQIHFDFEQPDETFVKADEVFCCLGTTISNAGNKAAFYKVDFEYVLRIAAIAFKNGTRRIALVSSMGANKHALFFYSRTKGQAEEAVSSIGYEGCFIFRPSILLGNRKEFRMGESIMQLMMKIFSFAIPAKYKPVECSKVATAMVQEINSGKTGVHVFDSLFISTMHL
jgi:uncharacterized protein YbjT (DUF2867 family)